MNLRRVLGIDERQLENFTSNPRNTQFSKKIDFSKNFFQNF